jgi:MarC family membrane protein
LLSAFLLAFPALFSIVNPLGGAIIFHEVTARQTHAQRVDLARRVSLYSAIVMLVTLGAGSYILSFFGITIDALRIAGGLVVAVRAYEMLNAPQEQADRKQEQAKPVGDAPHEDLAGYAFFPLTLPFTTGPGTIAVAVSLGTERPDALTAILCRRGARHYRHDGTDTGELHHRRPPGGGPGRQRTPGGGAHRGVFAPRYRRADRPLRHRTRAA